MMPPSLVPFRPLPKAEWYLNGSSILGGAAGQAAAGPTDSNLAAQDQELVQRLADSTWYKHSLSQHGCEPW